MLCSVLDKFEVPWIYQSSVPLEKPARYYVWVVCFQNEVKMLRNEVAQLKTLLLAHKDCPVTVQMQNSALIKSSKCEGVSALPELKHDTFPLQGLTLAF